MLRRFWLVAALSALAVASAVWFLRVDEVKVEGVASISARAIIDASGLEPGQRILWERLTVAERKIEEIPAVRDVIAERALPSTVILRVFERTPIARLDGARQLVVDPEGVVFPAGEAAVERVLYGWKAKRVKAGTRLDSASRTMLEALPTFPAALYDRMRKLRIGDRRTFTTTLDGGTEVRFGVLRDLEAKAIVAAAIIDRQRAEGGPSLAYIDVRSPTVPVARDRVVATPTPAPGAAPGASPGASGPAVAPSPSLTTP